LIERQQLEHAQRVMHGLAHPLGWPEASVAMWRSGAAQSPRLGELPARGIEMRANLGGLV
jgi:hypothetical protein